MRPALKLAFDLFDFPSQARAGREGSPSSGSRCAFAYRGR